MNDRLEWFPCYPAKLLGALAGMKSPEGYVYVIVLLRIYESGGVCRDTIDALATRTRMNKRVVTEALQSLFKAGRLVRDGDGITNPVAVEVIAESKALLQKRKHAGAEGGKRAAENRKQNQQNDSSKATAPHQHPSRQEHIHKQDSLFPDGNRAPESKTQPKPPREPSPMEIARKGLFDRGKEVLGQTAGGMVQNLLAAKHGNIALARAAIEQASTMDNPREYIGGILRGGGNAADRSNGRGGYARIAATIRRARNERADDPTTFFDAGGSREVGGYQSSGPSVGMEGVRKAKASPPIIDG